MALSPNYNWSEPDNSSLVKDGAQAMRTLGDAIDTSVWNVGMGQAGKNKVINGAFQVWQRGAGPYTTLNTYNADRMSFNADAGTYTLSRATFTPGTAPVAGYEGSFYAELTTTVSGSNALYYLTKIEDVRTFANQTVTLSYWAKCNSGTVTNSPLYGQDFGSGGSSLVAAGVGSSATITTSWQRFTHTFTLPSISGKTIGTSSNLFIQFLRFAASATIQVWGLQLEAGSVATAFQTATGTIQGELAACQRYYWRFTGPNPYSSYGQGGFGSSTTGRISMDYPVTLRSTPTAIDFSNLAVQDYAGSGVVAVNTLTIDQWSLKNASLAFGISSGGVAHQPVRLVNNATTSGYLGISAEL
jgi:hypothetical protein